MRDDIQQRTPIKSTIRRQRMRRFWGTIDFIEKHGIVLQDGYERMPAREELRVNMPNNRSFYTKTMFLTDDHKAIRPLFEVELGKI